jgi:hypothetical protein
VDQRIKELLAAYNPLEVKDHEFKPKPTGAVFSSSLIELHSSRGFVLKQDCGLAMSTEK